MRTNLKSIPALFLLALGIGAVPAVAGETPPGSDSERVESALETMISGAEGLSESDVTPGALKRSHGKHGEWRLGWILSWTGKDWTPLHVKARSGDAVPTLGVPSRWQSSSDRVGVTMVSTEAVAESIRSQLDPSTEAPRAELPTGVTSGASDGDTVTIEDTIEIDGETWDRTRVYQYNEQNYRWQLVEITLSRR